MIRWQIRDDFGLEHLTRTEAADPEPGPRQVRIRIKAVSLNYRDHLMIRGQYDPRLDKPFVPCSDGVGVVDAVGDQVSELAVGDRVCPIFSPSWMGGPPDRRALRETRGGPVDGTLCDVLVEDARSVVKVPDYLTDVEAATLPCAALTAWSALSTLGQVGPGDTVLTLGTGGVSLFAVQLARRLGATVVSTTSTARKARILRELGAAHVVLYTEDERWGRTVRSWSEGGVDHVVEVGGAGTLTQSLDAVKIGGAISLIGVLDGAKQPLSILPIFMKAVQVQGVFVGHKHGFRSMLAAMKVRQIRPVIDRVFDFEEAPEAFRAFAEETHIGKVCIELP